MDITCLPSFVRFQLLGLVHSTTRLRTHSLGYTASKPISTLVPEVVQDAFKDVLAEQSDLLHNLPLKENAPFIRILSNLRTAKEFCLPAQGESLLSGIAISDDLDSGVDTFPQVGILPSTL